MTAYSLVNQILEQVCNEMGQGRSAEDRDFCASIVGKLDKVFRPEVVMPCIARFTEAELDAKTPGKLGLGRTSAFTPRLGAYYRSIVVALDPDQQSRLRSRVEHLLLAGYITAAGTFEDPLATGHQTDPDELFRTWIPLIYLFTAWQNSALAKRTMEVWTGPNSKAVAQYMDALGMSGGVFRSKRSLILREYVNAGMLLRRCEIQTESARELPGAFMETMKP